MDGRTARRYAKALFGFAQETEATASVRADLQVLASTLEESLEFQRFVTNPLIPSEQRRAALATLFKDRLETATYSFLELLENKGRLNLLSAVCRQFEKLCDDEDGVTHATIRSAHPLNDEQVTAIAERLGRKLGRTVLAQTKVEPELLGGFSIQVADSIYDASAITLLQSFKRKLIHA